MTSWCGSKCTLVLWSAKKCIECKLNINNRKPCILKKRFGSVIFDLYFYTSKIILLSKFNTTNIVIVSTVWSTVQFNGKYKYYFKQYEFQTIDSNENEFIRLLFIISVILLAFNVGKSSSLYIHTRYNIETVIKFIFSSLQVIFIIASNKIHFRCILNIQVRCIKIVKV